MPAPAKHTYTDKNTGDPFPATERNALFAKDNAIVDTLTNHETRLAAAEQNTGGGGSAAPPPVNYAAPVTHTGSVVLDATAFGKHHVLSAAGSPLYTVGLPAPTGNAGKLLSITVDKAATGMWALQGVDIDGESERRMWAKETALLECTGTGYRKIGGRTIPLVYTVGISVGGLTLGGLGTLSFDTVVAAGAPSGMFNPTTRSLIALRKGIYIPALVGYCTGPNLFRPIEVFAAKNGDVQHPETTNKPVPVVAGPGGTNYASLEMTSNPIQLGTGDYITAMYYADQTIGLDNSGAKLAKLSLTETPTW